MSERPTAEEIVESMEQLLGTLDEIDAAISAGHLSLAIDAMRNQFGLTASISDEEVTT